jgi:hypothetical protein
MLYLDTARMGQMTPGAQAAHQDFARLVGSMGASVPVERLLREGYEASRGLLEVCIGGLSLGKGLQALKNRYGSRRGWRTICRCWFHRDRLC